MKNFRYNYRQHRIPFIPIAFKFQNKETRIILGIIDTGATFFLINKVITNFLKLQLNPNDFNKVCGSAQGTFKTAEVKLDIIIGHASRRELIKNVTINVSPSLDYPQLPLIGRTPLFDWYNINLDNDDNVAYFKSR